MTRSYYIPKGYQIVFQADGKWHPYVYATYGASPHWHGLTMVGFAYQIDAIEACREDAQNTTKGE